MAYVNAKDVAQIRKELKEAFPKFKFGVRKGSGSLSVSVTIKSGPTDFSSIFREYERSKNRQYAQINTHWLGEYGEHTEFFKQVVDIIKTAPSRGEGFHKGSGWFDESDAMVDYFHTAYYIDLNVGSWDKSYEVK
jgi:hypothetical protein